MRWIIGGVQGLIEAVKNRGFLTQEELEFGIRLYGVAPTRPRPYQDVMAYVVALYNMGCIPGTSPAVLAEWLRVENRPDVLQELPEGEVIGLDADDNRELLLDELEGELQRLRAEEARLTREVDQPSLEAALKRVSILTDADARRVARSHSEARTTYHRASSALWPMLDREKEEGPPEHVGDADADGADAGQAGDAAVAGAAAASAARDVPTGPHQDPLESAAAVPPSASRYAEGLSQIEPERSAVVSPQIVDDQSGSVERQPAAADRQNDVPTGAEAFANTPREATAAGGGSEDQGDDHRGEGPSAVSGPLSAGESDGEGSDPTGQHQAPPEWAAAVPPSASRICRKAFPNQTRGFGASFGTNS